MKKKAVRYDSAEYVQFCDEENPENGYLMTRDDYSMIKDIRASEDLENTEYFVEAFKLEKIKEGELYDEYGIVPNSSIDFPVKRIKVPFLTRTIDA